MAMTMTQKILAAHAGKDQVQAGELILVRLDRVLGNDITSPVAIREFEKMGFQDVYDRSRVTMVMDHFAPNKDIKAAIQCKMCRDFCRANGYRTCAFAGKRIGSQRRRGDRSRFSHVHVWRARGIFYRRGFYGYGVRYGNGKSLV